MEPTFILAIGAFFFFLFQALLFGFNYIKCPPGKILVIYGKVSADANEQYKIVTAGAEFVWPVIQAYVLMDAEPFEVEIINEVQFDHNEKRTISTGLICKISEEDNLIIKAVTLFRLKDQNEIAEMVHDRVKSKIERHLSQNNVTSIDPITTAQKIEIEDLISNTLRELGMRLVTVKSIKMV